MSKKTITDTEINSTTDAADKIHVQEHNSTDAEIFTVYSHTGCWKRIKPINAAGLALWLKQETSGNQCPVSEGKAAWLNGIWKRRDSYPCIHRFPRNDENGERLLSELASAHASGQTDVAIALLDQIKKHLATSILLDSGHASSSAWKALPRIDPSLILKTKWLISSFLAEGNTQLAYGERGSFKSTFFLAAAKAVANGEQFLGMKTRRRRVLYLDYENPANVIKARNDDLELNLPFNANLVIWNRFGNEPPPRPGDPRLEAIVRACVEETGHGPWLIFDSWSSLLKPGDGGEFTGQSAPIYLNLRRLADLGATITIIDHSKKKKPEILYGGEDKEAKADLIHNLRMSPSNATPNNTTILVESWLKRAAPQGVGSFAFEVQGTCDEKGEWHIVALLPVKAPAEREKEQNIETLRSLIKENTNLGQDALSKLAAERGIPRELAISLLRKGDGKYWQVQKTGHNKSVYSLV